MRHARVLHALAQKHVPIFSVKFGFRRVVVVSSPWLAEECLNRNDIVFPNRPRALVHKNIGYDYTAISAADYRDRWSLVRRTIAQELLGPMRLHALSRSNFVGELRPRQPVQKFSLSGRRSEKKSAMAPRPILAAALPSETGRVLSIQSHTVQGYVGNKSAVFPLQLLGYDVDPINSVQFSNHTGYPTFKGQVLNGDQLWDLIEGLEANNLLYYTHLLTGYIGSVSFLNTVLKVVDKLRSVNPGLTYVCDPVLGDVGKLYVPKELISVYREKVVPVASMLTPNQFEAELLTGLRIASEQDGREACNILHAAGPSKVVLTSINISGNLLLIGSHMKEKGQPPKQFRISIPKIPAYFTGTGDLMTALLLGWSNKYPDNVDRAAELSVSSLQALLLRTLNDYTRAGHDCQSSSLEIRLIQSQDDICNPEIKYKAEVYS